MTVLQRAKETTSLLSQRGCDLLLIGQHLADEDGLNLIKALRSRGPSRQLAIVALLDHAQLSQPDGGRRPVSGFGGSAGQLRSPGLFAQPAAGAKTSLRL